MKILVTGSNGFVGKALVPALEAAGHQVVRVVRTAAQPGDFAMGDIDAHTDWSNALQGVEAVVHLAALVHQLGTAKPPLEDYLRVNMEATMTLARTAEHTHVKRFVFMSSIKAVGEGKTTPYTETDTPAPEDAYGISKWEAEQQLKQLDGAMEVVILRPPLVYGPGVRANFLRLIKLAGSGFPLPLGAIRARRSMVYVGNLVDAVLTSLTHPNAKDQTFFVSDGEPLTLSQLLRLLAKYLKRPVRLLPVPVWVLHLLGNVTGKQQVIKRLTETLAIDSSKIRRELAWNPPFTTEQGIETTVAWYVQHQS